MKKYYSNFINWWSKNYFWIFLCLFFFSRVWILTNPPLNYSDVTHYYEKYANTWHYGLPPYTKSVFEYGPAAALLIYAPLRIDLTGIGQYYFNYRAIVFVFDFILMFLLLWTHKKQNKKEYWGIWLYLILTTIARDWLYEGIDLVFTCVAIAAIISLLKKSQWQPIKTWVLFWLSTALKFLTLPLMVPFYLIQRKKIWQSLLVMGASFLLIWGLPLAIFRSSLSVSFVYNGQRTVKYNTITSNLIRSINYFTQSEQKTDLAPDFSYVGPISQIAQKTVDIIYPLSLILVLVWSVFLIFKEENQGKLMTIPQMWKKFFQPTTLDQDQKFSLMCRIYLICFLVSFFTAKIYSNPFLIWILPMLIIYPWRNIKNQKWFYIFISAWTIIELTPFLSAGTLGLNKITNFNLEAYDIFYNWARWCLIAGVLGVVMSDKTHKNYLSKEKDVN